MRQPPEQGFPGGSCEFIGILKYRYDCLYQCFFRNKFCFVGFDLLRRRGKRKKDYRANPTFSDEAAAALFETASEPSGTNSRFAGKKAVVNLGALQTNFRPNETVTLETLKEKRLVPRGAGYLKILARGELDKPLTVEANDFSFDAVRAIALAGGKAIKRL